MKATSQRGLSSASNEASLSPNSLTGVIDLNSDLGEGFGPWRMGDDNAMLRFVTSANVACGGHAGDPAIMVETLKWAQEHGVVVGAHPGFCDREGFGRRLITMSYTEVEQLVATQIGTLMGAAALVEGATIQYVKPHGALGNWAASDRSAADAISRATKAVSPDLAILAMSGTQLERAGSDMGIEVYSELFADRGYLPDGQLVPRSHAGALIHEPKAVIQRLVEYFTTGFMPTVDGSRVLLKGHSICVHGDGPEALSTVQHIRQELEAAGVTFAPFVSFE